MSISLIRFIPAAVLITLGIAVMAVGTIGIFRIRYVLNRLHAAAMGDSLGLLLITGGLVILYGFSLYAVKLLLIILLFWITSPVCAHLLSSLEAFTNDDLAEHCDILPLNELHTLEAENPEGSDQE